MSVTLQTNDETQKLTLTNISDMAFGINVVSRGFGASIYMEDCETGWFQRFVEDLKKLNGKDTKCVEIVDITGSFIRFELNELGHLVVLGELRQFFQFTQQLKFTFRTDQTALTSFIPDLERELKTSENS